MCVDVNAKCSVQVGMMTARCPLISRHFVSFPLSISHFINNEITCPEMERQHLHLHPEQCELLHCVVLQWVRLINTGYRDLACDATGRHCAQ